MSVKISVKNARALVLGCQGLDGSWKMARGRRGTSAVLDRLGYVQIDSISVVQRAHHHTLWSRQPDYKPAYLHQLLSADRRVFEYWAPAASYVPVGDYRYYLRQMRQAASIHRHVAHCQSQHKDVMASVKRHIARHGAASTGDFRSPEDGKRGEWWDWKPTKLALEALFALGDLMVSERRHFHRLYDLAERVLPKDLDRSEPTSAQSGRFAITRSLGAWGVLPGKDIGWAGSRYGVDEVLQGMVDAGEVVPVIVEGQGDTEQFALRDLLERAMKVSRRSPRMHILSPFDSMVINRRRLLKLFGFDCKLECYLPAAKRRWGYFCLPILFGRTFIGRVDAKADRREGVLRLRRLLLEPGIPRDEATLVPLARRLREFAAFNDCSDVRVEATEPKRLRASLQRHVALNA